MCGAGAKSRPLTAVLVPVFDTLALFPEATVALGVTGEGDRSEFGIQVSREERMCLQHFYVIALDLDVPNFTFNLLSQCL